MPIAGRNRKREPSPSNERPTKRQRINNDLRNNILAAYAAITSPRKSRRSVVNPGPMEEIGKGSVKPQAIPGGEQPVHTEEESSVSHSTRIVTSHNKRTYGGKGRARAVHQGTANGASTSYNNVDDLRDPDAEEGKGKMVEPSSFTKGTPRKNPRGNPSAGETHEGLRDEAMIDIFHSRESPSDHHSTKSAKSASPRSPHAKAYDSDTAAVQEPEDPPISPINDSSKVNRLSISSALLAVDRRSPTGAQLVSSDGVGEGSPRSVEVPLPKMRGGKPRKSKTVPKEYSTAEELALAPQPITREHQRGSMSSNGKGKCVLHLHTRQ